MRSLALLLLVAGVAGAGEADPIHFEVPSGWTVDADEAKARAVDVVATDTRTLPGTELVGTHLQQRMAADEAFVRGFIRGAKKRTPSIEEVRHDFVDIAGRRSVRIVADMAIDGEPYRQVFYAMPAGPETALLAFTTARDAFETRLPSYDSIARATRGLGPPPPDLAFRIGYAVGQLVVILAIVGAAVFFIVRRSRKPAV